MIRKAVASKLKPVTRILRGWPYRKEQKIFCIGRNKTGTTSIHKIFQQLEIPVGAQREAERLAPDWGVGRYDRIEQYVRYGGIAFQDVPFSLPGTYREMDERFPGSKFILSVRDSADVWYDSLVRFQSKLFGNGSTPTKEDLQKATYIHKGWVWKMNRFIHNTPEDDLYNEEAFKSSYLKHNADVKEYFSDRPEQLLVVNLKEVEAAKKISAFLNTGKGIEEIPWENKT
jgi:hypothetical protein